MQDVKSGKGKESRNEQKSLGKSGCFNLRIRNMWGIMREVRNEVRVTNQRNYSWEMRGDRLREAGWKGGQVGM